MVKSKKRASVAFLSDENYDTRNTQLTIYIVKRDVIFKRLENIYTLTQRAEKNPQNYKALCASASNIDNLLDNYEEILDSYNMLNLRLHPDSDADYESWMSFEEMYSFIKQVLSDNKLKK